MFPVGDDGTTEYESYVTRWRRQHDENPDPWHTRRAVQSRVSNGLDPCPYCKIEELPSL